MIHHLSLRDVLVRKDATTSRPDYVTTLSMAKKLWTFSTRQIAFGGGVVDAGTSARILHLCVGDIDMNPGLFSTPTPTNCQRLM